MALRQQAAFILRKVGSERQPVLANDQDKAAKILAFEDATQRRTGSHRDGPLLLPLRTYVEYCGKSMKRRRIMADRDHIANLFNKAQSNLVVQTSDLPLATLAGMVEEGAIDLEPGFQRRERWTPQGQSLLIESFLMNVPVPPVYLAEEASGTFTAIDGKQRLRAIADFINGRLKLRGLESFTDAEGLTFAEMPTEITNAFRLRPYLRVVTLLKQTDESLKYEVFLRLNRGGEALNPQEIRNVAFRGAMNERIYALSEESFLRQQLKIKDDKSASYRLMQDAEFVLRFLALDSGLDDFRGSLSKAMDYFMLDTLHYTASEASKLGQKFKLALDRCEALWEEKAFRRPDGPTWRDQTLAGMYDAQMLSCSRINQSEFEQALQSKDSLLQQTRDLFKDQEFDESVRSGTNTPARIHYRVQRMTDILKNV